LAAGLDSSVSERLEGLSTGISIASEVLLSARDVTRILPSRQRGRKMHISTVHRWWSRGYKGVVLESIRIGGQRFTSLQALQRFFDRITESTKSARGHHTNPSHYNPTSEQVPTATGNRSARQQRVEMELDALGL
jgi:hypothetical protein